MKLALALSFAVVSVLGGCGKKEGGDGGGGGGGGEGGGKVASCHLDSLKSCVEYNEDNLALGTKHVADLCTVVDKSAVFAEKACPTADVIGACRRAEGKDVYYKDSPLGDAATLEKSCSDRGGTWSK